MGNEVHVVHNVASMEIMANTRGTCIYMCVWEYKVCTCTYPLADKKVVMNKKSLVRRRDGKYIHVVINIAITVNTRGTCIMIYEQKGLTNLRISDERGVISE